MLNALSTHWQPVHHFKSCWSHHYWGRYEWRKTTSAPKGSNGLREWMNHCLKYELDCLLTRIHIKIWIVEGLQEIVHYEFLSITPCRNPTEKFFSVNVFQSRCVSHMKITNVRVGTIHWNVIIASKFSYQLAIFIFVCNSHFWSKVPMWTFAIFIWVCNFHMSLQFSYQFAILTSRLQTSYVRSFILIPV